jgi:hypothetical protein
VEFSTYTLHSKSGKLESMSGEFYQLDNVNTNATLSKEQAFKSIKRNRRYIFGILQPKQHLMTIKPEGELVLLPLYR